ncbi:hypothetical protein [Sorangium sp. So ce693]|uniref:hypothetical protein n=1 Tax=Sorangium sp. So ce693 TaxID=3133318 RepID=UPI003F5E151C
MKKMVLMAAVFVTACGAIDDGPSSGDDGISGVGTDVGDDGFPADGVGLVSEEPVGEAQQALKLSCDVVCGIGGVGVQSAPMVAKSAMSSEPGADSYAAWEDSRLAWWRATPGPSVDASSTAKMARFASIALIFGGATTRSTAIGSVPGTS